MLNSERIGFSWICKMIIAAQEAPKIGKDKITVYGQDPITRGYNIMMCDIPILLGDLGIWQFIMQILQHLSVNPVCWHKHRSKVFVHGDNSNVRVTLKLVKFRTLLSGEVLLQVQLVWSEVVEQLLTQAEEAVLEVRVLLRWVPTSRNIPPWVEVRIWWLVSEPVLKTNSSAEVFDLGVEQSLCWGFQCWLKLEVHAKDSGLLRGKLNGGEVMDFPVTQVEVVQRSGCHFEELFFLSGADVYFKGL